MPEPEIFPMPRLDRDQVQAEGGVQQEMATQEQEGQPSPFCDPCER